MDTIMSRFLIQPVGSGTQVWPSNQEILTLHLSNEGFTAGRVRMIAMFSWDDGQTWPEQERQVGEWSWNERSSRDGNQGWRLRYRTKDGKGLRNPTHYRVTLEPVEGEPMVGVR